MDIENSAVRSRLSRFTTACTSFALGTTLGSAAGCGDPAPAETTTTAGSSTTGDASSTAATDTITDNESDAETEGTESDTGGTTTGQAESSGSDSDGTTTDGTTGDTTGGSGEFVLTSPAFEEGGLFPGTMHHSGGNISPELNWTGAPAGTLSFGLFFHDVTLDGTHSAIWNIPSDASGLPEGIEAVAMPQGVPGALQQCQYWSGAGVGYGGPGSPANDYEFTLYALDVATIDRLDLADQNLDNGSACRDSVLAQFDAHEIASATLGGQSNGP